MKLATVGTSWITESFIESWLSLDDTELYAVYSRNADKAEAFRQKHGAAVAYASLEKMAADENVQAVYIASPNVLHYEQAKLFLQSGKHVICEKPFCLYAKQIEELYRIADANQLVFCEAIMGLHSPDADILKKALPEIGTIRSATLDFSQYSSKYPAYLRGEKPNIFHPEMGTGCLMDLGVYNVYLMYMLFGCPEQVKASAVLLDTGADAAGAAIADYGDKTVTLTYSKTAQSRTASQIFGDKGVILIESVSQFGDMKIIFNDGTEKILTNARSRKEIMAFEAADFTAYCKGKYRCIPYDEAKKAAVAVARIMEDIRADAGNFQF